MEKNNITETNIRVANNGCDVDIVVYLSTLFICGFSERITLLTQIQRNVVLTRDMLAGAMT